MKDKKKKPFKYTFTVNMTDEGRLVETWVSKGAGKPFKKVKPREAFSQTKGDKE